MVDTLAAVTIAKDHPKYRSEAFKKVDTFDLTKVEEVEKVDEQYENALADSEKKGQEVREWITEHSKTGPEKLLLTDVSDHVKSLFPVPGTVLSSKTNSRPRGLYSCNFSTTESSS